MYLQGEKGDFLDEKVHQLWYKDGENGWYPAFDRTFSDEDYDRALRYASYDLKRGKEVRLVTSVITYVL